MRLTEALYYLGYRAHRALALRQQKRLPAPVISIGNITTGGTGKTPATIALAREALARGRRPAILTRGYKGQLKGPVRVEPGMKSTDVGDEPLLIAQTLPEVPVIKGADRYASGVFALQCEPKPDLFILDDGFQHRKLWRDIDILLINSRNPFGGERLLPLGRLREPLSEIKRADVILVTKYDGPVPPQHDSPMEEMVENLRAFNIKAPVHYSSHRLTGVVLYDRVTMEREAVEPVSWLRGREMAAFSGIAEPGVFRAMLEAEGAKLARFMEYPDHYKFTEADIEDIRDACRRAEVNWIMTTEKDIMRLKDFEAGIEGLCSLGMEFKVEDGLWDHVFQTLRS